MGKIGNNFEFVARVKGKSETQKGNKPVVVLTLTEKDGKEFDWTSFDVGEQWDAVKRDDVIKVNAYLAENPNGKWPFKNLDSLVATGLDPKDIGVSMIPDDEGKLIWRGSGSVPQSAPQAVPVEYKNGRGPRHPDERASIERQSSVKAAAKVCDLIASHYPEYYTDLTQVLSHAEENLPQFLKLAGSIYDYYSNRAATDRSAPSTNGTSQHPDGAQPDNSPQGHLEASQSQSNDRLYEPLKLENVGHVLMGGLKRWKLSQKQVCEFFGVDSPTEIVNSYTMAEAWEALKAHYDGPDGRK